jgi:hypothetical protein
MVRYVLCPGLCLPFEPICARLMYAAPRASGPKAARAGMTFSCPLSTNLAIIMHSQQSLPHRFQISSIARPAMRAARYRDRSPASGAMDPVRRPCGALCPCAAVARTRRSGAEERHHPALRSDSRVPRRRARATGGARYSAHRPDAHGLRARDDDELQPSTCTCELQLSTCTCELQLSTCTCELQLSTCTCELQLSTCTCELQLSTCTCELQLSTCTCELQLSTCTCELQLSTCPP